MSRQGTREGQSVPRWSSTLPEEAGQIQRRPRGTLPRARNSRPADRALAPFARTPGPDFMHHGRGTQPGRPARTGQPAGSGRGPPCSYPLDKLADPLRPGLRVINHDEHRLGHPASRPSSTSDPAGHRRCSALIPPMTSSTHRAISQRASLVLPWPPGPVSTRTDRPLVTAQARSAASAVRAQAAEAHASASARSSMAAAMTARAPPPRG